MESRCCLLPDLGFAANYFTFSPDTLHRSATSACYRGRASIRSERNLRKTRCIRQRPILLCLTENASNVSDDSSIASYSYTHKRLLVQIERLTSAFPLWVLGGAVLAVLWPGFFTWVTANVLLVMLCLIMLSMGLSTSLDDFRAVCQNPRVVLFGVLAQFTIMPILGYLFCSVFELEPALRAGLLLVATAPGGTASNVVCQLANSNVALSILMTLSSTCVSVFISPLLMKILAGSKVSVNASALFASTLQVVILPLAAGIFLRSTTPRLVEIANPWLPFLSVICVTLICASVVSSNVAFFRAGFPLKLIASVFLLHAFGFLLGYLVSKLSKYPEETARTVSIEVGMQNSGLAASLAATHFASAASHSSLPLATLPPAISATMHSLIGSLLAALWRQYDGKKRKKTESVEKLDPE
uniref:Uncharacterized protein n=1 Tax=Timspurckia oligopyrenoides TaxID=708627 RepID=A0A7S0ZH92_9RHOD|mmetsp:Transcript_5127/g.8969  ORF Transcript_5127/g.8969 Transcript_5127/m.8969 type:complete len:414 (+) Transcript_5127:36-1277(+)